MGQKKIIFAGNQEYPPLVFLEKGEARGIYPDIIRALIRRGDVSIQSFNDLKDKTVGVIPSSVPIVQLRGDPGIRFHGVATYMDGFQQLREGKVAALILNEWVAAYTLFHNGIDNIVPVKPASVIGGPASFGVRVGNEKLIKRINTALRELKNSGELDEILEHWSPQAMIIWPESKLRNLTLRHISYGVAVVLVLLLAWIAILWRSLKRARAAEQSLQDSHRLLENLTRHVPSIIFQFQMTASGIFSVTYISEAVRVIQEAAPKDIQADFSLLTKLVHPDDKERFWDSILMSAKNLSLWRLEYRVLLPKQGVRWRIGEARPEKMKDGRILWHGYIADISEQKITQAQIAELSAKIIDLREKEYAEISRELHDTVGQGLVLLKLQLENRIKRMAETEQAPLAEIAEMLKQLLATTRDISRRLSPLHLKSLGIVAAIEDLCDQIRRSKDFRIRLDIRDFVDYVSGEAAIQIYRIVQEALTNILKHSNGDEIQIFSQTSDQSVRLVIADNGRNTGKRQDTLGIGLQIMRERARMIGGLFEFHITENGARVEIELPKVFALAQSQHAV